MDKALYIGQMEDRGLEIGTLVSNMVRDCTKQGKSKD